MKDDNTTEAAASMPSWETLENFARHGVQQLLQRVLEEEVEQLLGRRRSQRRAAIDPQPGYRNGYGKRRKLAMSNGTIEVRRPRVRGLEERFESRILPLFKRRTQEVGNLLPELYLHGLAERDFDVALRGLLGDAAPLSPGSRRPGKRSTTSGAAGRSATSKWFTCGSMASTSRLAWRRKRRRC